jgi:hypothetical protein
MDEDEDEVGEREVVFPTAPKCPLTSLLRLLVTPRRLEASRKSRDERLDFSSNLNRSGELQWWERKNHKRCKHTLKLILLEQA